ncbi:hypothetical protein, partial [Marinobacter sp. HN1S83]|uniref:hypothetical protein n=1 Tax=Marinobacter sp. HN1S83 TaxID=3382301 RepID=UPI00387AFCE9
AEEIPWKTHPTSPSDYGDSFSFYKVRVYANVFVVTKNSFICHCYWIFLSVNSAHTCTLKVIEAC